MNNYYPFENLPLPYSYNSLEPWIDELTMRLHHDRHLQDYIDKLNNVLKENPPLQKLSLEQLIKFSGRFPKKVQTQIKNNAGGVYNHRFYFDGLTGDKKPPELGKLYYDIDKKYGSFGNFKDEFKKAALSVFGSGYAWLVYDKGKLMIITTPNQDTPLERGMCPIMNIDVWEHAYYLKNYNLRVQYINNWYKVVNWNKAEENYHKCLTGRL